MLSFQEIIFKLSNFWSEQGCCLLQPYDTEKGAGTMSPYTFFGVLGTKPWQVAYVEPARRPTDGRYAENPNRLQHYFQFQVIMKPSPLEIQKIYLDSLKVININPIEHDIRFVEDNWESPTLGAWGVGWEVWLNGMEITQFTYFQQCGGKDLNPIAVEITYGLERLAMFIQNKKSVFDVVWQENNFGKITYADIYRKSEIEQCHYNFEKADINMLFNLFEIYSQEAQKLLAEELVAPAFDYTLKCSHVFNLLDARSAISVTERMAYILKIRKLAEKSANLYTMPKENKNIKKL